jgi:hypothetical protein
MSPHRQNSPRDLPTVIVEGTPSPQISSISKHSSLRESDVSRLLDPYSSSKNAPNATPTLIDVEFYGDAI